MNSDKAPITPITPMELELTQRLQIHFPWGKINPTIVHAWNSCPKELITKRLREAFGEMPKISALLKRVTDITVTLDPGTFVASDHFRVDTSPEAVVKISNLENNFREWMLGLIEGQSPANANLCCYELVNASVDEPIIADLGGKQKAEMTLVEIYTLMKNQPNGEKGILLTNGFANIFYVRDVKGVLRAIDVYWDEVCWDLDAYSVERSSGWLAGRRVFSRNSF